MIAEYRNGRTRRIAAAGISTPQLAEQHLRHLEQALSRRPKQAGTPLNASFPALSDTEAILGSLWRYAADCVNYERM